MAGSVKKQSQVAVMVEEVDEEWVDPTDWLTVKAPKSYFFRLPIELREMIYTYLVPDIDVPIIERDPFHQLRLREDSQACSPQLLLANRQIYEEMIIRFYGSATFAMYVEQHEISFLGNPIYVYDPEFPSCLQYVRALHIEIQLPPVMRIFHEEFSECVDALVIYLSNKCRRLRYINFAFDLRVLDGHIPRNRMDWYVNEPQAFLAQYVRASFVWAMNPFKSLSGVTMVSKTGPVWLKAVDSTPTTDNGDHQSYSERLIEEADIYCRKLVSEFFK
jgi:hypothetical protein